MLSSVLIDIFSYVWSVPFHLAFHIFMTW